MYTPKVLESVSFRMCNEMLELDKQERKLEPAWCLEVRQARSINTTFFRFASSNVFRRAFAREVTHVK